MDQPRARAGALCACVLLAALAAARPQESDAPIHVIESRQDVLSDRVLADLPADAGRRVLGGAHRVHLLVNPALRDRRDPPDGLPERLGRVLYGPADGQPAPVHQQLKRVFRDYLELFFDDVPDADSLQSLVQDRGASRILIVTADAEPRVERDDRGARLAVRVEMRLWRAELEERAPYAVRGLELLYADRATGRVPLPAPGASDRDVYQSFRAAVIDALRGQIARSLWGRPRMLAGDWLGVRTDAIGGAPIPAAASGAAEAGASSGTAGEEQP